MQNKANWMIVDSLDMWGFTNAENVVAMVTFKLNGLTPRRKTAPIW